MCITATQCHLENYRGPEWLAQPVGHVKPELAVLCRSCLACAAPESSSNLACQFGIAMSTPHDPIAQECLLWPTCRLCFLKPDQGNTSHLCATLADLSPCLFGFRYWLPLCDGINMEDTEEKEKKDGDKQQS